jgi:hypothetical protein
VDTTEDSIHITPSVVLLFLLEESRNGFVKNALREREANNLTVQMCLSKQIYPTIWNLGGITCVSLRVTVCPGFCPLGWGEYMPVLL